MQNYKPKKQKYIHFFFWKCGSKGVIVSCFWKIYKFLVKK